MLTKQVSLYATAKSNTSKRNITLGEVFDIIKNGNKYDLKRQIEALRRHLQQGKEHKYKKCKNQLHAVTFSGVFVPTRANANLTPSSYTQVIVLDLDKQKDNLDTTIERAKGIPYSFCIFKSPSGNGCKILVIVDSNHQDHSFIYRQILQHYEGKLGVAFDDNTKDLARLCYLSHDPEIFINMKSKKFIAQPAASIAEIVRFTERKRQFSSGNRNNFMFLLACNLNRSGYKKESIVMELQERYASPSFDEEEILRTIESAYSNVSQHGIDQKKAYSEESQTGSHIKSQNVRECLKELLENYDLSPCDRSVLEILLLSELEEPSVEMLLLLDGFHLFQSQLSGSLEGNILKGICAEDIADFDQFISQQTTEIQDRYHECLDSSEKLESLPDIIFRIIIIRFKLGKIWKSLQEAFAISPHVVQSDAEQYFNQLQILERYQKSWSEELSELVEEYLTYYRN